MPPSRPRRLTRRAVIGLAVAVLLAVILMLIPYQTMREERMFALGSQEAFAKVVEVASQRSTVDDTPCRMVRYRFLDNAGASRTGESCLPPEEAETLSPGSVVPVVFATGNPTYNEAASAVQEPAKRWIREWARGE
ncbi:MAG: hypothetical protein ACOCVM_00460 [Desulfovibrionaceae bacterium]